MTASAADNLPRSKLKLFQAAAEDYGDTVDLVQLPVSPKRACTVFEGERLRPPKCLPPSTSHPTVSPRTRMVAQQLACRRSNDAGPVLVKQAIAAAIQASLPLSLQASRARAVEMLAEKKAAKASAGSKTADGAASSEGVQPATGEPQAAPRRGGGHRPAWLESRHQRRRRMDQLLDPELKKTDSYVASLQGELNALRDLAEEREKELALLQGEHAVLVQKHGVHSSDIAALAQRRDELENQLNDALADADDAEHSTASYTFCQERLTLRRPHLKKKLAFLRSLHIELAVRLKTQEEARVVALAAEERMDARLAAARAAFDGQVAEHAAKREGMKAELFQMGSAKRRALGLADASGQQTLDAERLRKLEQVIAEDHEAMVQKAEMEAARGEKRAEETFAKKSSEAEERGKAASVVSALTSVLAGDGKPDAKQGGGLFGDRRIGPREAWQRLCILTDCDDVHGVLEFWAERAETRAALENAEQEREELLDKQKRLLDQLNVEHLAARDLADSGRTAFDALLDAADAKVAAAAGEGHTWARRVERAEALVTSAFGQMRRTVSALSSRAVLERLAQQQKAIIGRMYKQIEEVDAALSNLAQPEEADDDSTPKADAPSSDREVSRRVGSERVGAGTSGAGERQAGVAASGISMAVASVLGMEADGGHTGSISEADLKSAQATLLCSTTETALHQLMDVMRWTRLDGQVTADAAVRRPDHAPQLEGQLATALNMRMPLRLPRREQKHLLPAADGTLPDRASLSPEPRSQSRRGSDSPPWAESTEPMRFRVAVLDPITLAGEAEIEAEQERELAAQPAGPGRVPDVRAEIGADPERTEAKLREFQILSDALGKDEASQRASIAPEKLRAARPRQGARATGRRPSMCGDTRRASTATAAAAVASASMSSAQAAAGAASRPADTAATFITQNGPAVSRPGAQSARVPRGSNANYTNSTPESARPGTAPTAPLVRQSTNPAVSQAPAQSSLSHPLVPVKRSNTTGTVASVSSSVR